MMFDLIPSLLAQQSVKASAVEPPAKALSPELAVPAVTLAPTPIRAIAPPESTVPEPEVAAPVPLAPQVVPSPIAVATPLAVPVPPPMATTSSMANPAPMASQAPVPIMVPSPQGAPIAVASPMPSPLASPSGAPGQAQNPSPMAVPAAIATPEVMPTQRPGLAEGGFSSQPQVASPTLNLDPLATSRGAAANRPYGSGDMEFYEGATVEAGGIRISLPNGPVATPKPHQPTFQAVVNAGVTSQKALSAETRLKERRQVIERKLAEIVAKDRVAKASQKPEADVVNAVQSARKGRFDKARQLANKAEVAPVLQTQLLVNIAALEAEQGRQKVVREREKIRTVQVQKQLNAGNSSSLVAPRYAIASYSPTQATPFSASPLGTAPFASPRLNAGPQSVVWYRYQPAFGGGLAPTGTPMGNSTGMVTTGTPSTGGMIYPLPMPEPITSNYGWRIHPITGVQKFHTGTDIGADEGTPILAVANGRVATADSLGGYGLAVVIEHNNGTYDTLYGHMSEIFVRPGQWVTQGSLIGRVGTTGFSTGPHLHFELRQRGAEGWSNLDPGPQLEAARQQLDLALRSAPHTQPADQISRR